MLPRTRSRLAAAIAAAVVGAPAVLATPPAHAATEITVDVKSSAVGAEIESTGGILYYNSLYEEQGSGAYQIGYLGEMDMSRVWNQYTSARSGYIFSQILKGYTRPEAIERWERFKLHGGFDMGFTIDPAYVSVDAGFVTCDALQPIFAAQNPGRFADLMTCQAVSFDPATGAYLAKFETKTADGEWASTKAYDNASARPNTVIMPTPEAALYVEYSKFQADEDFFMTKPFVEGTVDVDQLFVKQLPVNFKSKDHTDEPDGSGAGVRLSMEMTYDTDFAFEALADGRELPEGVTSQLPPKARMGVNGSTVTPPQLAPVEVDQGHWAFVGWNPPSQKIAGENLTFVGQWQFVTNPDAQFTASHAFMGIAREALPDEILELLPESRTVTQGETIVPDDLSTTHLETSDIVNGDSVKTRWDFAGWDQESVVVDGTDVEFTGTWEKTTSVEPVRPITPVKPVSPNPGGKPGGLPETGAGEFAPMIWTAGGILASGVIALLLARRHSRRITEENSA